MLCKDSPPHPREQIWGESVSKTVEIGDAYWLEEPHVDRQTQSIYGHVDDVPWRALMQAGYVTRTELGWTHLIDFGVGAYATPEAQGDPYIGFTRPDALPIDDLVPRAWRAAQNTLEDFETTRRCRRAIEDELSLSKSEKKMKRPHSEELQIALSIYELVAEAGRRDSNLMIAAVTGWSQSKSEKLIAELRAAKRVGPARRGFPTPKKKRTKK